MASSVVAALSSAALETIFMSIRKDSTFSFLVAGSICARLGPSSSSASATSLARISAPLTLASTGFASSARTGSPASRASARQPATAVEARPNFMRDDKEVMENPYLQSPDLQSPYLQSFGVPVLGGGTLAQSCRLGNAKNLSK